MVDIVTRLWGGRFKGGPAPELARLSKSEPAEWRLVPYDLAGSRAHARELARAGVLDARELESILSAIAGLETDVHTGTFFWSEQDEDTHTAMERGLLERLGPLGGKLRAGRSRNDQAATDLRLYLRDQARALAGELANLQKGAPGPGPYQRGDDSGRANPPSASTTDQLRTPVGRPCPGPGEGCGTAPGLGPPRSLLPARCSGPGRIDHRRAPGTVRP